VRGVGGTRNCDWWLTNEAILLDTAGRWSTDDDDREEWLAFLDLLKGTRPKKPINGILVAVSAIELQGEPDEIEMLARKLRERVDEVMGRLEMVVPVYLLVTKGDLIPGFIETFGDLRDKERGQIWGISLPLVADGAERTAMLEERLEELQKVLELRSLRRVGEERGLDARPRIYEFPQQFASLRGNLTELCAQLFADNAYQDAPIMRGVYFTSGTQEGRPIDRIMVKMAEAFGIRPRMDAGAAPVKPKSYFVRDLFTRVVIPDRDVAVRSSKLLKKERLVRLAMTLGALALAVAFLFVPISSYLENRQLIADAMRYVDLLSRGHGARDRAAALAPSTLESVDAMSARLARIETKGPDVSMRFGLYVGDAVMEPLAVAVERLLARPLLDEDAAEMTAFLQGRGGADADAILGALEVHLLLTQPKAADEPAPENQDLWRDKWSPRLAQMAGGRWEKLLGERATTRGRHSLENALLFYALRTPETPVLPDRRSALVNRVRSALLGGEGDPLADLIRDPSLPRDLRMIDIVGGAVTVFRGEDEKGQGPTIPGAFTPDGWKVISKRLELLADDKHVDEDAWVLGEQRKKRKGGRPGAADRVLPPLHRRLEELLPRAHHPRADFCGCGPRPRQAAAHGEAPRHHLAQRQPQPGDQGRLDHRRRQQARGLPPQIEARWVPQPGRLRRGEGAARGRARRREEAPDPGSRRAARAGLRRHRVLLLPRLRPHQAHRPRVVLPEPRRGAGRAGEAGAPEGKSFNQAMRAQQTKLSMLFSNYNGSGWESALLERMLMPPLHGAGVAVLGATGDSANRKWCESIVVAYDQLLGGRYPFVTGSKIRDARVADLEKFFQPKGGTLWQYFADPSSPTSTTPPAPRSSASGRARRSSIAPSSSRS
jgi:type VI secretion system protein ImpL